MKQKIEDALPIGYALVALLAGGWAYRACQSERGWGNSPENAWFACFGTFAMVFVVFLVINEALPPKASLVAVVSLSILGVFLHLVAF